ncbi:MAG: hypothetical protein BWX50_01614 [Euryarchaeota archaeon ADurb.Bin009]|nr:MAG: hypothetical protein BWX50_01614 [Euryarchaeota archaeon ADurb.Bin009]
MDEERVACTLKEGTIPLFALLQRLFCLLPFGDLGEDDREPVVFPHRVGVDVVPPAGLRVVLLEPRRFLRAKNLIVAFYPERFDTGIDLGEPLAHDPVAVRPHDMLIGRIDVEDEVVDGSPGAVADHLVERKTHPHRREDLPIRLIALPESILRLFLPGDTLEPDEAHAPERFVLQDDIRYDDPAAGWPERAGDLDAALRHRE